MAAGENRGYAELETGETWKTYVAKLTWTRVNVTLTPLAFLNPPRLRNKARFMNLECVVTWGRRALQFLQAPRDFPDDPIELDKLEAKLGWLREFEGPLAEWEELLAVIEAVEEYVRRKGYHRQARRQLRRVLTPLAKQASSRRLMRGLLDFVQQESWKLNRGACVLGHTEVLESLLGKYKQTQARHSQGGMTASLLNIGAAVMSRTPEVVHQALSSTPVNALTAWVRSNLGQTVASKQRLAFR